MNRKQNEIKHFTELSHIWWGAKTFAGQKRYDNRFVLFKEKCKPSSRSRILEIGCGDGEFTSRLAKLNSKVFATDITPSIVKKAKKKMSKVRFRVEDAEKFSFKNESMDIVCGISILHHINFLKAFEESYRVLKKDGQIFFSEPNYLNPIVFSALHWDGLKKRMEYSPDETALLRFEIQNLLKMIGFLSVEVFNYDFLHPSTPEFAVGVVEKISSCLEKLPIVKEASGSIIIWAKK